MMTLGLFPIDMFNKRPRQLHHPVCAPFCAQSFPAARHTNDVPCTGAAFSTGAAHSPMPWGNDDMSPVKTVYEASRDEDTDDVPLVLEPFHEPPLVDQFVASYFTISRLRLDQQTMQASLLAPAPYVLHVESMRLLRSADVEARPAATMPSLVDDNTHRSESQKAQRMLQRLYQEQS